MTPEQFLEFARVLPEPLLLVNGEGQLLVGNQPMANMLGLRRQEISGKILFDIVTDSSQDLKNYLQACASSRAMVIGSLTLRKHDGQTLICRSQGAVIQPSSPESPPLILLRLETRATASNNFLILNKKIDELAQEIRKRKRAEAALLKANEELENRVEERTIAVKEALKKLQITQTQLIQAEKMSSIGNMVAGVAHEINNPISFIDGNLHYAQQYTENLFKLLQLYEQDCLNISQEIQEQIELMDLDFIMQDMNKLFQSMKRGTERIQGIVKSLRNFSRLDESELKRVNIHEGIDSTLMILQHRLQARGQYAEIKVNCKYGKIPPITCYAGQLNQVLFNIVANSIDALQESAVKGLLINYPEIQIQTQLINEGWVCISITDNGSGMDEKVRTKIFDPFFTTKPVGKGTGLGLFVSYQIVEKHDGELSCFSTPGKGTKFVIKIPINRGANLCTPKTSLMT
ncbi:ATP-binding protein [Nodularia harveyana UHCC-0300]|uniref:histidine kinase n=1 Tax=Nodularia harveyana UHCC-0300 TaxID=2974287 RepID=A0ABU5UIS0_9CYAN|nr:ATP-binding protein [Nodularia harveyana]MEA5583369.1 ATP-binding protein [Nodularia harveyana UHCC-0300]